ncbi:lipid kinase YegS [Larsenimonas rhizosphaerae]|uniref:lipid kinase YegS n=1 Tax=Larsenimonas rhizosphaerae TaxID=2944682 RepID=UPI0020332F78|nr:lipid kinase YegS [Larsenimonas rhizosphaerae]MCM2130550.1 lipid kinase YegS [Larsenimonas rhizosphaerae]
MTLRLLLNGKSSGNEELRAAIFEARDAGHDLDVRVSWEGGDIEQFVIDAHRDGIQRIIVGGGDGTINEAATGLMALPAAERPEMGIIPMGTANDFATGCGVPLTPDEALMLAIRGQSVDVDVGQINDKVFLNMASGGFGAKITTSTPPLLKKMLGGGAYSLVGAIRFWSFEPYAGRLEWDGGARDIRAMVLAIGNGRQAGGSQELTPRASIDDGLLDVMVVDAFGYRNIPAVVREMEALGPHGRFVHYFKTPWVSFKATANPLPINLDGEFHEFEALECSVNKAALRIVLPETCRLLTSNTGQEDPS